MTEFTSQVTPTELQAWLARSKPGESICYGIGTSCAVPGGREEIANVAWEMHDQGRVLHFQKRLEDGIFAYQATHIPLGWIGRTIARFGKGRIAAK